MNGDFFFINMPMVNQEEEEKGEEGRENDREKEQEGDEGSYSTFTSVEKKYFQLSNLNPNLSIDDCHDIVLSNSEQQKSVEKDSNNSSLIEAEPVFKKITEGLCIRL